MTLRTRIAKFHEERSKLLTLAAEEVGLDPDIFVDKAIPQSELFMAENIQLIHDLYLNTPVNKKIEVLDVGPQAYGGTALLERLHRSTSYNKLKMTVSAIDITDQFDLLREVQCPQVDFIHADIFEVQDRTWDCVVCSHVIEHVPDPGSFLLRLTELARDYVIVACPWKEDPLVTNGHINTINRKLIQAVGGLGLKIYMNYNWGKDREVCQSWIPGKAK